MSLINKIIEDIREDIREFKNGKEIDFAKTLERQKVIAQELENIKEVIKMIINGD